MEQQTRTYYTITAKGQEYRTPVSKEVADTYLPEAINTWVITYNPITVQEEMAAGAEVVRRGLLSAQSPEGDRDAVLFCKGRSFISSTKAEVTKNGEKYPPLELPVGVLGVFAVDCLNGIDVTLDELNALKKPLS